MTPTEKLMSICHILRLSDGKSFNPDFICTTDEKLAEAHLKLEDISGEAYDGPEWENVFDGDSLTHSQRVHVFRKSLLEK